MFCLDRPKDRQQRVGDKEFVDDLPRGLSLFRNNGRCQNPRQPFGVVRGGGGGGGFLWQRLKKEEAQRMTPPQRAVAGGCCSWKYKRQTPHCFSTISSKYA